MILTTLTRTVDDEYAVAVDFTRPDVFDANPVTSAVVTVNPAGLTLGTVSLPATNFPTFEVTGGTADVLYIVTITATNGASPPDVLCRSFGILTTACDG